MRPPSVIPPRVMKELADSARGAPEGDFVEVGVYKGGSAAALAEVAREQGRRLFLFDTFCGIPFQDPQRDRHKVGDFGDTSLEAVQRAIPDAICVKGIFPQSMIDGIGPIALAHIDCDQYQSVRDCCLTLAPLMRDGGIMIFDDCDALPGAAAAVREVFAERIEVSAQGKTRVRF
jgi:O-methyltransferase